MKLSSKLPARNGLTESALERELLRTPTKTRWLIAEVVCGKIETTFDEFGDPYQTATAQVVAGEYITDTIDLTNLRMISRRAFDARRGEDTIPGVEATPPNGVHQTGLASDLTRNRNLLMNGVGYLSPEVAVDMSTGEILDEDEPR